MFIRELLSVTGQVLQARGLQYVCKDKSVTQRLQWDWYGIVSTVTT